MLSLRPFTISSLAYKLARFLIAYGLANRPLLAYSRYLPFACLLLHL